MVLVRLHKGHVLRQLPSYDLREHLVVLSREHDVHIVIPRDEAAVAHRAQKRAGNPCVLDLVLSADPVISFKSFKLTSWTFVRSKDFSPLTVTAPL
mgnify:CR=1 FL=1